MTAAPPSLRDLEAIGALRGMVIGCIGVLCGGVFVLCAAFELGGPVSPETGLQRHVALVLGGAIFVLAGFSFVRGLVAREELRRGPDALSIILVALVTVPLAALGIGGYVHTHPPDKRLADAGLPYSFKYPGAWERDSQEDLPAGSHYGAAVSRQVEGTVTEGALVYVFRYRRPERLPGFVRRVVERQGGTASRPQRLELDGHSAFRVDVEIPRGVPFGAHIVSVDGQDVYWVSCVYREDPDRGRTGCSKVLDTFEIRGLDQRDAAPGTAARGA